MMERLLSWKMWFISCKNLSIVPQVQGALEIITTIKICRDIALPSKSLFSWKDLYFFYSFWATRLSRWKFLQVYTYNPYVWPIYEDMLLNPELLKAGKASHLVEAKRLVYEGTGYLSRKRVGYRDYYDGKLFTCLSFMLNFTHACS